MKRAVWKWMKILANEYKVFVLYVLIPAFIVSQSVFGPIRPDWWYLGRTMLAVAVTADVGSGMRCQRMSPEPEVQSDLNLCNQWACHTTHNSRTWWSGFCGIARPTLKLHFKKPCCTSSFRFCFFPLFKVYTSPTWCSVRVPPVWQSFSSEFQVLKTLPGFWRQTSPSPFGFCLRWHWDHCPQLLQRQNRGTGSTVATPLSLVLSGSSLSRLLRIRIDLKNSMTFHIKRLQKKAMPMTFFIVFSDVQKWWSSKWLSFEIFWNCAVQPGHSSSWPAQALHHHCPQCWPVSS